MITRILKTWKIIKINIFNFLKQKSAQKASKSAMFVQIDQYHAG